MSGAVCSRQTRIHDFPRYCCLVSDPTDGRMGNYILSLTRGRHEKSNEDLGKESENRGGGRRTVLSTSPRRTHEATRLLRHRLCTPAPYGARRLPLPQPRADITRHSQMALFVGRCCVSSLRAVETVLGPSRAMTRRLSEHRAGGQEAGKTVFHQVRRGRIKAYKAHTETNVEQALESMVLHKCGYMNF